MVTTVTFSLPVVRVGKARVRNFDLSIPKWTLQQAKIFFTAILSLMEEEMSVMATKVH